MGCWYLEEIHWATLYIGTISIVIIINIKYVFYWSPSNSHGSAFEFDEYAKENASWLSDILLSTDKNKYFSNHSWLNMIFYYIDNEHSLLLHHSWLSGKYVGNRRYSKSICHV